jgi:hypothetical protein
MKNNWQLVPVMIDDIQYNLEPNDLHFAIQQYSQMAFGKKTREEIRERAGNRSEVSGRDDMPLHASHFFHGRGEAEQDKGNGILLTVAEHVAQHMKYRDNPEDIGLSRRENEWAIFILVRNVVDWVRGNNGTMQDVATEINNAREDLDEAWKDYF